MNVATNLMTSPNALKRNFDEADLHDPSLLQPQKGAHVNCNGEIPVPAKCMNRCIQEPLEVPITEIVEICSPVRSSSSSVAGEVAVPAHSSTSAMKPSTRRRKLTVAEQEAKKMDQEAKDRQKADEKAKQEENKRIREVEKEEKRKAREIQLKIKDEEKKRREEEKQKKEEERQKKEEEKQKKEEEKNKKEKSQLRLNSFFSQPSLIHREPTKSPNENDGVSSSSRRNSINSTHDVIDSRSRSVSTSPQENQLTEYTRAFPPFFLQSYTVLAPMSRFSRNEDTPGNVPKKTDECSQSIANTSNNEAASFHISELHRLFPHRRHCVRKPCRSVKEVVERFQNTSQNPIDLTSSSLNKAAQNPTAMLKCISIKYLKFAEDVRPPYIGTYSKSLSVSVASRLRKNPFSRSLPTTNYDYDSEAEWEDPGEGEDLESEGDEEAVDDEEGDEMDGFLDDEDVGDGIRGTNIKRRPLIGDLEPSSTGLCWENPYRTVTVTNTDAVDTSRLKCFRLELISDSLELPIDPHSNIYWQQDGANTSDTFGHQISRSAMEPPRMPLNVMNHTNKIISTSTTAFDVSKAHTSGIKIPGPSDPSKPAKRLVAPELMESFKTAIQGCDLTKAGLVEVLKKQFPKQSKDAIKDTIGLVAERIGSKEADKRWVIKADYSKNIHSVI